MISTVSDDTHNDDEAKPEDEQPAKPEEPGENPLQRRPGESFLDHRMRLLKIGIVLD